MQDIVIVGEVQAGEAAKVHKSLQTAITQINVSTFDVIDLLWKVKSEHLYTTVSFNEYLKTLKIKLRKAQYLTQIGEVMHQIGCTRFMYESIGVSKLREIARLNPAATYVNPVTKEEYPMQDYIWGLMELAPDKTVEEIADSVRVLKGEVGENDKTWLNLPFTRLVMDNAIRPALEKAKKLIGTVAADNGGVAIEPTDAQAMEIVCVEFKNDTSTDPDKEKEK